MPAVVDKPETKKTSSPHRTRSAVDERRRGIRLLIVSAVLAAAMFALWWLVATTNREGQHDAELLPLVTLFALVPAIYHLIYARYLKSRGK